jgi:hypothetical protein
VTAETDARARRLGITRMEDLVERGFASSRRGPAILIATPTVLEQLDRFGFHEPARWDTATASAAIPGGRGGSGRLRLPDGRTLRLKRMRRGGLLAPLWRDRFVGRRRLLANLAFPREVAARGIATPIAEALLLVTGPFGLQRGWLATGELPGEDLVTAARAAGPPDREGWHAVMTFVRAMHDRGVEHRDLNASNLLWTRDGGVAVVDLDGARLWPGPLPFAARRKGLRRLDRSWVKELGDAGHVERMALWHELYAADDRELERRLGAGARVDRRITRLHRLR